MEMRYKRVRAAAGHTRDGSGTTGTTGPGGGVAGTPGGPGRRGRRGTGCPGGGRSCHHARGAQGVAVTAACAAGPGAATGGASQGRRCVSLS